MLDICIYKGACRQEHFLSERVLWAKKRKGGVYGLREICKVLAISYVQMSKEKLAFCLLHV